MGRTGQRISGCKNCRVKHLKCDDERPCQQCVKKSLHCDRSLKIRFRHVNNSKISGSRSRFPSDQKWCKLLNQNIEFVDQTLDTARSAHASLNNEDDQDYPGEVSFPSLDDGRTSPATQSEGAESYHEQSRSFDPALDTASCLPFARHRSLSQPICGILSFGQVPDELPLQGFPEDATVSAEQTLHDYWPNTTYSDVNCPIAFCNDQHNEALCASVSDRETAELLRHFFSSFSHAFDLGDPDKVFTKWLSTHVWKSTTLLHLSIMIASKHLGKSVPRVSGVSPVTITPPSAQGLHDVASATISSVEGEDLATIFLLRFTRIMEGHLLTAELSLNELSAPLEPVGFSGQGSIQEAIQWANLRLEVYGAVVSQTPSILTSDSHSQDKAKVPVDDRGWANLMLLHLAHTIRYCFSGARDALRYHALVNDLTAWNNSKPKSFTPIYISQPADASIFPEVWLYNESVAAGLQYYHLARILLVSHDPCLPKIGSGKILAMKQIEVEMKNDAKVVCGIAEGMGRISPRYLIACMAIALVGDLFSRRHEQDALIRVLTETTRHYGWPTSSIQTYLKETWGWV